MKPYFSLLKSFDLFSQPIFLKINQEDKPRTYFGSFLSLIILSLLIYQFSKCDMFLKLSPKLLIQTIQAEFCPRIFFENRLLSLSIADLYGYATVDPTMYSFRVQSHTESINSSIIDEKTFHFCNISDVGGPRDLENYYFLEDSYCLDHKDFPISGSLNEENREYLTIDLFLCQNSTENNNSCKSPEEISEFFKGKYFQLMFTGNLLQTYSLETPFDRKYQIDLYKLDVRINKIMYYNFQKVSIETDDGVILSNVVKKQDFLFEKKEIDISMADSYENPILSIYFLSSTNVMMITRIYQSLPEVIAILGGLFSFLHICGKILSNSEKKVHLTKLLMNSLYSFQQNSENLTIEKTENLTIEKTKKSETMVNLTEKIEKKVKLFKKTQKGTSLDDIELVGNSPKVEQINIKEDSFILDHHSEENVQNSVFSPITTKKDMMQSSLNTPNNEKNNINDKNEKKDENEKKEKKNEQNDKNEKKEEELEESLRKSQINLKSSLQRKSIFSSLKSKLAFKRSERKKHEKDLETLENFVRFSNEKNTIKFSLFEYFSLICKKLFHRKKNFKEKLYEKAEVIFEKEIDIAQILKRIQDIEKLKCLVLSPKQLALFNLLEKPMIFVNVDNEKKSLLNMRNLQSKIVMEEAFEYFVELEKKEQLEPIDKRLLLLVQSNFNAFQQYFEQK